MEVLAFIGAVVVAVGLIGVEATTIGRFRLRRYLNGRGWSLAEARWRGPVALRQAQFRIRVERDGQILTGRAYVGGWWLGPTWSTIIKFDWDTGIGIDDFGRG